MSWEVMSDKEKTCSCGKGTVRIKIEMDDWNRTRESEEIKCEECQKELIRKKKIQDDEYMKYVKLSNDVIIYFKEKYLTELLKYFEQYKSKKSIWEEMSRIEIEKRSLQSFYNHNKNFDQQKYIEDIISIRNIHKIISLISIKDEILEQMLEEPFEIDKKNQNRKYNEDYIRYRKK